MITESARPVGFAELAAQNLANPRTSLQSGASLVLLGETYLKVCLYNC